MNAPREERIRWSSFPAEPRVELLWAEDSGRLWRWFHETYTVCTLVSAPSEWTYRGKDHRTSPGEVMMMEPGEVHVTRRLLAGVSTFRVVLMSAELVERAARELGGSRPHLQSGHVARPDVHLAFTRLHASVHDGAALLEQESRLAACLQRLVGPCAERPLTLPHGMERAAVRRAKELLHERVADPIRLEELAAVAGLSRFHFLRAFSRDVGMPPHAYQIRVRVERARLLLGRGMTVAEIAAALGFADQSHLARHFREVCGVSPRTYLAQRGRGQCTTSTT